MINKFKKALLKRVKERENSGELLKVFDYNFYYLIDVYNLEATEELYHDCLKYIRNNTNFF